MAILDPLSYKQQKFCEEYLLSFNAYRAALTAGYTDNTARKGDLLHVPKIQAYLKEAMSRSAARAELTHDMLLRELMKVAFCNMGNYYDDHGDPKRMHQLTDDEKAAISYFQRADVTGEDGHITGELFKIKLHNKMAAIDKLCRHTGFYKANWQPNVVIQPNETEEDVAFEAESAKTLAEPFTNEVSGELLEQSGVLEEMQESRGKNQDDLDIVGEDIDDGVVKLQDSGIVNPRHGWSRIENPDQRPFVKSKTGLSVESPVNNILTLSPPVVMEDGKGKMEDVLNILTLSPLPSSFRKTAMADETRMVVAL